jgi:peptidoglycan/LPS O-acetylase OafA/YrhL
VSLKKIVESATDHGASELNRIDYLDGWRGIAIIFVLISHFMQFYDINLGRMGVDIFFVLSGMLMSNILFVKKVDLTTFYKRRISRIFPVFFVFLTTVSIISWIYSLSEEHSNYFYNLLFIRAYWPVEPDMWSTGLPLGHLWSLNVEEHSYILLSIFTVIPFIKKKPYLPILLLGLFSVSLHIIYSKYPSIASADYGHKTEIAAKFILLSAGYFLVKDQFEKYVPKWLPIFTLLVTFLCYSKLSEQFAVLKGLSPFLLAFTVNHLNLTPQIFKEMLCFRPLRLVGLWSFSIYLWQEPLYYYGTKGGDAFTLFGLILMILSIMIGAASFYWIENPTRKYLNTNWKGNFNIASIYKGRKPTPTK